MGESVTIVAATKYVSVADMAVLAEAGVDVVGENRAQELERKHAEYGDTFRWHFIGHLQSNKVKVVNRICEPSKSGVEPDGLSRFLELFDARGLMTMPPETTDPEASRQYFKRLRALAESHGLHELSMGTSQDYRIAAEEGATLVRVGSVLYAE